MDILWSLEPLCVAAGCFFRSYYMYVSVVNSKLLFLNSGHYCTSIKLYTSSSASTLHQVQYILQLAELVSTIQSAVLTADIFQFFIK